MNIKETEVLNAKEKNQLIILWNKEYPKNIAFENIEGLEGYLSTLHNTLHSLVMDQEGNLMGWFCEFDRNNARWFAMIMDTDIQGQGVGTQLLNKAKQQNKNLLGWVITENTYKKLNGEPYRSPVGFYKKMGFTVDPSTILPVDKIKACLISYSSKV